jgi:hypothetical protein
MYRIKGRQFLLPVDRDPRPFLISTMLQIFSFIVNLQSHGQQDCVSALKADDYISPTYYSDLLNQYRFNYESNQQDATI